MKVTVTRAVLAVFALAVPAAAPAFAQMGAGDAVPAPAASPAEQPADMVPLPQTTLSSAEITELQTLLAQAGFDPGGVDGLYGPATYAAIVAYQQSVGMTADGEATADLLQGMRTNMVGAAPAEPSPLPAPAEMAPGGLDGGMAPAPAP